MYLRKLFRILSVGLFLVGCDRTIVVTYKSEPTAASLFEEEKHIGYTPYTATYTVTPLHKKQGYIELKHIHVRWASGAKASLENNVIRLANGYNQEHIFFRPDNHPGLKEDIRYAYEMEKIRAQQQAIREHEERQFWLAIGQLGVMLLSQNVNSNSDSSESIRVYPNECHARINQLYQQDLELITRLTGVAENGSCYGEISNITGRPKTTYVRGYCRDNYWTYVKAHFRS